MKQLSRREFIHLSALAATGIAAAACAKTAVPTTAPGEKAATAAPKPMEAAGARQAPILQPMVESGTLPPVGERLPKDPAVVSPYEATGTYGGTCRAVEMSLWQLQTLYAWGYDETFHWDQIPEGDKIVPKVMPGVGKGWESNDDGTVYDVFLREGMKWSDGQPFSADDFIFWYENVMSNDQLWATIPFWWQASGEPMKMEKVDDYTVRFLLVSTRSMFPEWLASMDGGHVFRPKHYLSQFHPAFAKQEELDKMVADAGLENWMSLYGSKDSHQNLDRPVHRVWMVETPEQETGGTHTTYQRNPYYLKVDPDGNQLPYFDKMAFEIIGEPEMKKMKAVQGEGDIHFGISWADYTLLQENAEAGNYRVFKWTSSGGNGLTLNMSNADPVFRPIIRDVRFRHALSYAIDRDEINEIIYYGLGKPMQATVVPESPFFKEEYAQAQAEYDPDRSEELLDEMGLTDRDDEGYRLRPDGQRLSLLVEIWRGSATNAVNDELELLKKYLKEVGVELNYKVFERNTQRNRMMTGETQVKWGGMGYAYYPYDPTLLTPSRNLSYFAPREGIWYTTRGEEGDEPEGDLMRMCELWDETVAEMDSGRRTRLFDEILQIHAKNNYYVGTVGALPSLTVVKNSVGNVPERGISSWICGCTWGWSHPEQWTMKG